MQGIYYHTLNDVELRAHIASATKYLEENIKPHSVKTNSYVHARMA